MEHSPFSSGLRKTILLWKLIFLFALLPCNYAKTRVSWKECNITPSNRSDCGYHGIKERVCYKRECCFAESYGTGAPNCYHSKRTINKRCVMDSSDRASCGHKGIRKEQCLHLECCWQPTNKNAPWCYQKKIFPLQTGECGNPAIKPNVRPGNRIVGGVDAKRNSWPWQVSLQANGRHYCGGSIVNEYWVASAAHCYRGIEWSDVKEIVVGLHNKSDNSDSTIQRIPIETYYMTERNFLSNDSMMIKLERPIQFTDAVSPVCIPEEDEQFEDGMRCYITGWGTLMLGENTPETLQQVRIPLLNQETCVEWYSDPQNSYGGGSYPYPVTDDMICAGYEEGGRGSCHGDSGGPLVCYKDKSWKQAGIVSWGGPCAHEKTPSVFARASYFRNWMQDVINEHADKEFVLL